mgnify:CR=1 FL=1
MKKLKDLLKESHVWERKFGEKLPTLADTTAKYAEKHGKKKVNERTYNELEKYETAIFDVIIQFKKIYERSEHKKNRKINKLIQDLLKIEAKLGDEVTELS